MAEFTGTEGNEFISGTPGDDTIDARGGNDNVEGGAGNDLLDGGAGQFDYAVYSNASSGVTVNLGVTGPQDVGGGQGVDTLVNIEGVIGSPYADTLTGSDGDDNFTPEGGNDLVDGGAGQDRVNYWNATGALHVDLNLQGVAQNVGGGQGADTLISIERVTGGVYNDVLIGTARDSEGLDGGAGDDTLQAGGGNWDDVAGGAGNDYLDGGAGDGDTANYYNATGGVRVDLNIQGVGQAVGGGMGFDTLVGIEGVHGGAYNDTLIGTAGDNWFSGNGGDDVIDGGAGQDGANYYGAGASGVRVDLAVSGPQNVGGGAGVDTLISIEGVVGSEGNDTLLGTEGNNWFEGREGDDFIDGRGNWDNVNYHMATGGVQVDLAIAGAQTIGGGQGVDTLLNIESLTGSSLDDTLSGSNGDNGFDGGAGNDLIDGRGGWDIVGYYSAGSGVHVDLNLQGMAQDVGGGQGMDTLLNIEGLDGSSYNDTLIGSDGDNSFAGLAGDDVMDGRGGGDTASYWSATSGVTVSLAIAGAQFVGGGQGSDTLISIESLNGSAYSDTLTGNDGDNFLGGDAGDDSLVGAGGNDGFDGGAGNDTIQGGVGYDYLNGNVGDDSLSGGDDGDNLEGGAGNDVLDGGAGFDNVNYANATGGVNVDLAIAGAQVIGGGQGTDTLISIENIAGSQFSDNLFGNADNNFINGFAGNDLIQGRAGFDDLKGGDGDDTLQGGADDDLLEGGAGNDVLDGGAQGFVDRAQYHEATSGVNVSLAISGAQAVGGGMGVDTLISIEGLDGSQYGDTLTGDANNNLLVGGGGDDLIDGGAGVDQAQYFDATGGVRVDLSITTAQAVGGGLGADTLLNIEQLWGSSYGDTLSGNAADNYLGGNAGNDSLSGRDGNDNLEGGQGDDVLDGGAGTNDSASYFNASSGVTVNLSIAGPQAVGADQGVDTLSNIENLGGSRFGDTLSGDAGVNYLGGQAGNDQLNGLDGNDNLEGGQGSDTLDGGAGFDNASYFNASGGVTVNLSLAGPQAVGADQGVDSLINIENLSGSQFADTLTGDAGSNFINGQAGSDRIVGLDGNDNLTGADGNDTLDGGDAVDTLQGGNGDDQLLGGASNDILIGGAGNDLIDGGDGQDIAIYSGAGGAVTVNLSLTGPQAVGGGQGVDTLVNVEQLIGSNFNDNLTGDAGANFLGGGAGGDTLNGGDGNDVLSGQAGNDLIFGGAGQDVATFSGARSDYDVQVQANGDVIVTDLRAGAPDGSDTISGVETLAFSDMSVPSLGGDRLVGTPNDDFYAGSPGNDTYSGLDGSDDLRGGAGNDLLQGDGGDDFLRGQGGNDTLQGGAGDDYLVGAGGANVLDGGDGFDRVSYFGAPAVQVDLRITGPQDTGFGVDTLINIENVSGTPGSDTLIGNDGANWLWGSATGNDSLVGNGGDDMLSVAVGDHVLVGGAGIDTVTLTSDATAGVNISLLLQGQAQVTGQGSWTLSGIENLSGSGFADTLTGDAGANTIGGDLGADVLNGGDGNDLLLGDGGYGIDGIGGSGPITLYPDDGTVGDADTLSGGAGADSLRGGAGNDSLSGGAGVDYAVFSGASSDYAISTQDGHVIVTDLRAGSPDGTDTLDGVEWLQFTNGVVGAPVVNLNLPPVAHDDIGSAVRNRSVTVTAANGVLSNDTDANGDQLTVSAVGGSTTAVGHAIAGRYGTLTLNANGSYTYAANANAVVQGGGAPVDEFRYTVSDGHGGTTQATLSINVLTNGQSYQGGSDHSDILLAGSGPDWLAGGGGDDVLYGGKSADVLVGGTGDDLLTGGSGKDVFVFGAGFGHDAVVDFKAGEDVVEFLPGVFSGFSDLMHHAVQTAYGVTITDAAGDTLDLVGATLSKLKSSDFLFV